MRYVIVDCGFIGLELARRWIEAGHHVVGTAPDPDQVDRIRAAGVDAALVSPEDSARIREVVRGADGALVSTRPVLVSAEPARERILRYRRSMINVVRAAASGQRRLVLFSSIAVYGDGGQGDGEVTEATPVTTALDPAAQSFAAVERMALESPRAAVLRLPDAVVGHPGEPDPVAAQWRRGIASGLPLDPAALHYLIDYRDAAAAVEFVLARGLSGVFNLVPDQVPPATVEAYLGKLAADAGVPPPELSGRARGLRRPVSSAKLRQAGFEFAFPTPPPG